MLHSRSARLAVWLVLSAPLLGSSACSSTTGNPVGSTPLGGVGDECSALAPCRYPLFCDLGICTIHDTQGEGDPCTLTGQCTSGLYCAADHTCQPAGSGGVGSVCTSTADCSGGLVCAAQTSGLQCSPSGTIDIGGGCIRDDQCLAGLSCVGIQCSDGTSGPTLDGGTGGMDAGLDGSTHRDSGGGLTDSSVVDGSSPLDGGVLPDANLGCDPTSCDDSNPCTIEMCEGTMCVNHLVDFDHDGYASNAFGRVCGDCSDSEVDAHPGQTRYFTTAHRAGTADPAGFDWNCNGTEEKQFTATMGTCSRTPCAVREGWQGAVPSCGARSPWTRCNADCTVTVVDGSKQQACR